MAEVSIIIPAYNQSLYVAEAIKSVCSQTFTDWELVVVDDGSTDNTWQVADGFKDSRITVLRQANRGVSATRNKGIYNSSAPLVTFLDADDLFMPDKIAVMHKYLNEHPEVGLIVGDRQKISPSGQYYDEKVAALVHIDLPGLLFENDIPLGGVMVRREWLERVGGFDESMHTCEDWDLWLRLLIAGCKFSKMEKVVVAYRLHSQQVTGNAAKMRIDTLRLWEKFFTLPDLPPDLLVYRNRTVAAALTRTSARAFRAGKFEMGNNDLFEAIKLDPNLTANKYEHLVNLFVGWANDPQTQNAESYLLTVSAHLHPTLRELRHQLRKAISSHILGSLFGRSQDVLRAHKIGIIKAIVYDPSWLSNRGVLRMIVNAWF